MWQDENGNWTDIGTPASNGEAQASPVGDFSGLWDFGQQSLTKALDYLIYKDAVTTRAELLPMTSPQSYYRTPTGQVLPVGNGVGGMQINQNLLLIVAAAVVAVLVLKDA